MTADRIRDGDYSNNNRRKRRNVKSLRREGRFPSLNNKALFTLAACSAALRLGMRIEYCSDTPDAQKRVCSHSRGWSTWRLPLRF